MLTAVYLEGPMGRALGREWHLAINSPRQALALIEANGVRVKHWIRQNLEKYSLYRVVCEFPDGRREELTEEEYKSLLMKPSVVRFVPLIKGAGAAGKIIGGIVLIAVGYMLSFTPLAFASPYLYQMGAAMIVGGVVEMLTPRPKQNDISQAERKDKTSYYFNGAVNTSGQDVPVQLIYGRVMCGSHAISAALSIDQLMGSSAGPSASATVIRVEPPSIDVSEFGGISVGTKVGWSPLVNVVGGASA